jgi:hypothetical protein
MILPVSVATMTAPPTDDRRSAMDVVVADATDCAGFDSM